MDDPGLLIRARGGDADAFDQLFARHQGAIYRYAAYMCGATDADDVVQETFVVVLRGASAFDASRGTVGAYLLGVARHVVLKRLGSRYDASCEDIEAVGRTARSPDLTILEIMTRRETVDAVRSAIASLPAHYREVIALCDLQEMEYQDAANVIQCPVGTIRSRLHRARALLAEKLASLRQESQAS